MLTRMHTQLSWRGVACGFASNHLAGGRRRFDLLRLVLAILSMCMCMRVRMSVRLLPFRSSRFHLHLMVLGSA